MLRRLATLILVVPLLLNGLWMVCTDSPPSVGAVASAASAEAPEHCNKICPIQKPETDIASLEVVPSTGNAQPGAICFLGSNGDGTSIAALAFPVATPASVISVNASLRIRETTPGQPIFYFNPSLAIPTPPPRG